jgi:hypothetical protein
LVPIHGNVLTHPFVKLRKTKISPPSREGIGKACGAEKRINR